MSDEGEGEGDVERRVTMIFEEAVSVHNVGYLGLGIDAKIGTQEKNSQARQRIDRHRATGQLRISPSAPSYWHIIAMNEWAEE
ncbi:hypothetical protein CVT26_001462 [Gymnopilus dilepis]|uniref:Uncharacterized protein n=1 Tax=Gymnopilus dilepis TaxID=231916 RepID=A0A409WBE3_9AGAR|nr:hypothetical protein CVT26_001462 [Gymnopilus dilepis]